MAVHAMSALPCIEPEDLVLHVYRRWRQSLSPGQQPSAALVLALITRLCRERLLEQAQ
jgi:hypothetical protein